MPISVGIVGYEMAQHERVAALITAVGGPVKAAALIKKTRTHIDNMRKPDARLSLDDLLPLCIEAGVSLDWVATGHQVRPDLAGVPAQTPPGLVQLKQLKPEHKAVALAAAPDWLEGNIGVPAEYVRYAVLDDDGMGPPIAEGALVLIDTRPAPLRSGGKYLVDLTDELVARRLNRLPNGRLELVADNNAKWRYELKDGDPLTMHRIVWAGLPL